MKTQTGNRTCRTCGKDLNDYAKGITLCGACDDELAEWQTKRFRQPSKPMTTREEIAQARARMHNELSLLATHTTAGPACTIANRLDAALGEALAGLGNRAETKYSTRNRIEVAILRALNGEE